MFEMVQPLYNTLSGLIIRYDMIQRFSKGAFVQREESSLNGFHGAPFSLALECHGNSNPRWHFFCVWCSKRNRPEFFRVAVWTKQKVSWWFLCIDVWHNHVDALKNNIILNKVIKIVHKMWTPPQYIDKLGYIYVHQILWGPFNFTND